MFGEIAQRIRTNSNNFGAFGITPIGGIVAWAGSFTGVPKLNQEWVQCNGQKITDTASPMFGQTLPNLNSPGSFLYGSSSSGNTGGATSTTISITISTVLGGTSFNYTAGGASTAFNVSSSFNSTATNGVSTLPPYYTVIWIMRIK